MADGNAKNSALERCVINASRSVSDSEWASISTFIVIPANPPERSKWIFMTSPWGAGPLQPAASETIQARISACFIIPNSNRVPGLKTRLRRFLVTLLAQSWAAAPRITATSICDTLVNQDCFLNIGTTVALRASSSALCCCLSMSEKFLSRSSSLRRSVSDSFSDSSACSRYRSASVSDS